MKIITEEQALRQQMIEMFSWKQPGVRVPGVKIKKQEGSVFAVLYRPFSRFVKDTDQVSHLYFSKDENQQLAILVTENRAFDKENIGKLRNKSNITLTVWENGQAIWHNKSALTHCKYGENLNRLLKPLFKNMENDPSWDSQLCQGIRKAIFEGVKMEKESPICSYSMSALFRQNKAERAS